MPQVGEYKIENGWKWMYTQGEWRQVEPATSAPPATATPAPVAPVAPAPVVAPVVAPTPKPAGVIGQAIQQVTAPVVQPAPKPAPAIKTQPITTQPTAAPKPYIRNPSGLDVYDRAGNYISAEKAASIPDFWNQVEILDAAPNTSKGSGLGGPVSGMNTGLEYIRYAGSGDVYEKSTGKYIDFDTANRLNIWNKVEDSAMPIDKKVLEDLGIDPTGETTQFKNADLETQYAATVSPYQKIYDDFKVELTKTNDKLEQAWLDYNMAVVEIEENPWLLTGEATQELNKLKKTSMAKIDALTKAKSNMLDEFNLAVGITEKTVEWQKGLEPDTQVIEVNGKKQLINSKTGEVIQELGKTTVNTQVVEINGRKLLINQDTGETIQDLGVAEVAEQWSEPYLLGGDYVQKNTKTGEIRTAVNVASGVTPEESDMEYYLVNQGLPLSTATSKGELSATTKQKAIDNGVSLDLITFLWSNIRAGNSFEEIRQGMRGQGMDTKYLDLFVEALQS